MLRKFITTVTALTLILSFSGCGSENQAQTDPPDSIAQTTPPKQELSSVKELASQDGKTSTVTFAAADLTGKVRESSEWIGKRPVVINFWGTWCPPCRREIPELVKLYDEYKDTGLEIISLAINDTPAKVDNYTRQNGMNWTMLMADRKLAVDYKITGVPTTIFLDKEGNIVKVKDYTGKLVDRFVGPRPYETFKEAFEAIL